MILGLGILVSVWNVWASTRRGAAAGPNPWRADTLEWGLDSPPAAYGTVHIPTVASRHPLWDDYDEEFDPGNQRVLDRGRLTIATTWRTAQPVGLSKMPEDTITPLLLAIALAVVFSGLVISRLEVALAGALCVFAVMAVWLWPEAESDSAKAESDLV